MGKCFLMKSGSGGSVGTELNFTVVGGTSQPENPAENTIWVNTDAGVTGSVFSADEPSEPFDGMVWIETSASSTAPIQAGSSEKRIVLYPLFANQYNNGVWQQFGASVYIDGAWVSLWDGMLYYSGNQYDAITGGWEQNTLTTYYTSPNTGAITFNADNIYLHGDEADTGSFLTTKKKVDVSNFDVLCFEVTVTGNNGNDSYGLVANAANDIGTDVIAATESTESGLQTLTVDVSSISGEYHVCVGTSAGAGYRPRTIHKIWLE